MSRRRSGRAVFSQALFRHVHSRRRLAGGPRPCPEWCDVDHATDVDLEGTRAHARQLSARVKIGATEDLETGEWHEPSVSVLPGLITTAEQAHTLALEILDAAELLEGGAR
ncbi:hypothetical protein ACQPZX_29340 [Actinoplanes sp. CA-142083]|uniref:hypothetical protein n=1 Tax=Actinoplanes sp. CA-142083 TaxID=3239903 RepID=UPI003D919853